MANTSIELPAAPDVTATQWDSADLRNLLEYDPELERYRVSFDHGTGSISRDVITTVAAVAEMHPQELPPLYSAIDPDALESLVKPKATTPTRTDADVAFLFHGHEVTVRSCGIIAVSPRNADSNSK